MRNILTFDTKQLQRAFQKDLPQVADMATQSKDAEDFKKKLGDYLSHHKNTNADAADFIRNLIEYDGKTIPEFSTQTDIRINTLSVLFSLLQGEYHYPEYNSLFTDLYYQFMNLESPPAIPSETAVKQWMKRWPSGLHEEVIKIRQENKERIIHLLIKKIEHRHASTAKYVFPEGLSQEEKYNMVKEWWNSSRFHLAMAVKSPRELNLFLNNSLKEETMKILTDGKKKNMPFFVTPYYISLLNPTESGYDDQAIRSYIIYSKNLVETFGQIKAWEREDLVEPEKPNSAGWLLPNSHNIHRRYPEVAILIPDSMGRACGGLCASCQRMYDFQSQRLNFEFETLKPKESWSRKLHKLMDYFEQDSQLRDILITGGDALMSQNATLANILEAVYKMAARKRKANLEKPDGEKYAQIQRVRLGSRLPAYLPMRMNDELIEILRNFKEKAQNVGITQFIIQTHFQTPLEITPEAAEAVRKIISAGWSVTNQLVFTVAASRRGHTARLRQMLNSIGVICYYTFTVKGFNENRAVFTPNSRSLQEQQEEKRVGALSLKEQEELLHLLEHSADVVADMHKYMKSHQKPFLATDRNVLNLPAIGKSMTFNTIGITEDGRRILQFEHDGGRHHSPIIDSIGKVYIVENKPIREYLLQLQQIGENPAEYTSVWNYTRGTTESRFKMYQYPPFDFEITDQISNLEI